MKFKPLTDCHVSEIRLSLTSCCLFQDEVVAVAEKAVLQISDLLDWIADPKEIAWDRGLVSI